MRFTRNASIILFVNLFAATSLAAWIPITGKTDILQTVDTRISAADSSRTLIEVTIPGINVTENEESGVLYQQIDLPGAGILSRSGCPLVPAIRKNIIVPRDTRVHLNVNVISDTIFQGYTIIPAQPVYKRTQEKPPFTIDQTVYNENDYYPADVAAITEDACLRDFRFVTVTITPVQFNPVTGEVRIVTQMELEILSDSGSDIGCRAVFPAFQPLYRKNLSNFELLNMEQRTDAEPMLIICHDAFISEMSSYIEWKTKRGIDVTIVSSTETGTSATAIQSYIQNIWATWNPQPVYILLVGDAPQLEPLTGIGSCASDSMFTLLEGEDLYPDVFISRISALSVSELNSQIDKILTYELTPPQTDWLNRFAGLASSEGSDPSDEEYSQEIEARFLAHNTDAVADRIYQSMGHGADEISAAVNDGRFWLSYIGHGSGTSWSAPNFTNSDVDALTNVDLNPFIMDVSCSNGSFTGSSDCFAERWMKNDGKGAVSMFSASTSCSWDEPAVMAWGVTYSVCGDTPGTIPGGDYLFGQMTCNGYLHMFDVFGTGTNTEEVMNQYVLFGDCSAMFRSDAAIAPDVDHLPTAPMAPVPFTVTVTSGGMPVEGAYVCAYKTGDVHQIADTDAFGVAVLDIAPTTIGDMIITVYGQNLIPQESIVMVAPAGCGVIVLDRQGYTCSSIVEIRVFDSDLNVNPDVVESVEADISSDSDPVPQTVVLNETGPDTSVFFNSVTTSETMSGPGWLLVAHEDVITAHYHDEDCDGFPVDVSDTADVDCIGPVISSLTVSDVEIEKATVSWVTSEPADTALFWGESIPPSNMIEQTSLTLDHSIILDGLDPCTEYYFFVRSMDQHGNIAIDDNGGSYYSFTTLQLMQLLTASMDTDPGWTYSGLWAWGVPLGSSGDPSAGFTGDTVVGYNLAGTYENSLPATYMTTGSFDCSGATQTYLSFWRWLGVESSSWDHASIEISNDGGITWNIVWEHVGTTLQETTWSYQEYDVSDWAAGYSQVLLRWGMGPSDSIIAYCGWNIDDVLVSYTAPCDVPILVYESHIIDDSCAGNDDGVVNPGELINMSLTLHNIGMPATGVSASLSTTNPNITIMNSGSSFPDIPQSGSGSSQSEYAFYVIPEAIDGESIPFTISWMSNENSGSTSFVETIAAPDITIGEYMILDDSGDGDGILDPGETAQIMVELINNGHQMAHLVIATMSSDLPDYITIDDNEASFPDIDPQSSSFSMVPHFTVTADELTPDHSTVTLTLAIGSGAYFSYSSFQIDVTSSTFARRFYWNMDTDPMWTTENQWAWGAPQGNSGDPTSGYSGPNVYGYNLAGAYENNLPETNLTTTAIDCSGLGDVELRFMRWLGVESSTYDHAYVRVSNDGMAWTDIWSHSGSTLTDPDWQTMTYDISTVADDQPTVYIRWVMGETDYIVAYCGWNIDDVEIWADSLIPTPTPPCIHHGD
ncbi:hypothetical protein JW823_10090, partial [bacterium]|nr:hypothetical protein [candidate division CSSED10-310 bacterium]